MSMVIFYPSFTETPFGQMHSFIGDTIRDELLVDPTTADAVLGLLGIRRDAYERAQSQAEIKELMLSDINKLKSYLLGPGITDPRFKEEVRNQVGKRFGGYVIQNIPKQEWQRFVLKSDDVVDYNRMKANIASFRTGALYSAYSFDDENLAVIIEASNTVMTLDKKHNDGSVRVANMKGKKGRPMNYSEERLYGDIEHNSNWIASDIYTWMKDIGFESNQMITESRFELGAKLRNEPDRPSVPSFKEGRRHATELLQREADLHTKAAAMLAQAGVLVGAEKAEEESMEPAEAEELQVFESEPSVAAEPVVQAETSESEKPEAEPKSAENDIETTINAALQKLASDKMTAEVAPIIASNELLPQYIEKFEKFLPYSSSLDMIQKKIWEEFRELRNHPNAKTIEKHLTDMTLQRMFLLNKMQSQVLKENAALKQGAADMKAQLAKNDSEVIRLKTEASSMTNELSGLRFEREELLGKITEHEATIEGFEKEIDEIAGMVNVIRDERDQLLGLRDENSRLTAELANKDSMLQAKSIALDSMSKSHETVVETMSRMESQWESMRTQNDAMAKEREQLLQKVSMMQEQLLSQNKITEGYAQKIGEQAKQIEALQQNLTKTQEVRNETPAASVASTMQQTESRPEPVVVSEAVPAQIDPPAGIDPTEGMAVNEAMDVMAEKIEETKSMIPPMPDIKVRSRIGRDALKAATQKIGQMNANLPKTDANQK